MAVIVVDNVQYFRAIDSQVRDYMKTFETAKLPLARQALLDSGLSLKGFPKEGYYYETEQLGEFFDHIRTMQEEYSSEITPAIKELHGIYTNSIFGLGQGKPTAINPNVGLPGESQVTISPVIDPITLASEKIKPKWTVDGIMGQLYKDYISTGNIGTCLVGLAAIVDRSNIRVDGSYNPLATCMARETTVLSAMKSVARSMESMPEIDWQVSPEVEQYGAAVIDGYIELFRQNNHKERSEYVSPGNIGAILEKAPSMERCVNLNIDARGSQPIYYHWAIKKSGNIFEVVDFWVPGKIITTQDYQKDLSIIEPYLKSQQKEIVPLQQQTGSVSTGTQEKTYGDDEIVNILKTLTGENWDSAIARSKESGNNKILIPFSPDKETTLDILANTKKYIDALCSDTGQIEPVFSSIQEAWSDVRTQLNPRRTFLEVDYRANCVTGFVDAQDNRIF